MSNSQRDWNQTGSGIAIGVALGVTLGVVTDNLALWIGVGLAIGVALETTWSKTDR